MPPVLSLLLTGLVTSTVAFVNPSATGRKLRVVAHQATQTSTTYFFEEPAWLRATEIGSIVLDDVVRPVLTSLATQGLPADVDSFWTRSSTPGGMTHAQRVAMALERLGCTYVKFGQALASRPDIVSESLAKALGKLHDDMEPFSDEEAREIIRHELAANLRDEDLHALMSSMSDKPVAAASIGQVYQAVLPGRGRVAIKVQRPGIHELVERDAEMLQRAAKWIETLPGLFGQEQLVAAKIEDAVEEFMTRVCEELDYRNEARNMKAFSNLYCHRSGTSTTVRVVVPELIESLCTSKVIVMEWIDGTKLTEVGNGVSSLQENLNLVKTGIECTLSQLLDTGIMHADPHAGNLLKVRSGEEVQLGYLDFGILSRVPAPVRDALACAVVQLVFSRDSAAVADLFGELQVLPAHVIEDDQKRSELTAALSDTFDTVFEYPSYTPPGMTAVPTLRFDNLLGSLAGLVTRFEFKLPPYFLNNARALGTLEGIARQLDPNFNVLRVVYPYTLKRLLNNPSGSRVVDNIVLQLMKNRSSGEFDVDRICKLLDDSAALTGLKRRNVVFDIVRTKGGRRLMRTIALGLARDRLWISRSRRRKRPPQGMPARYFRL